MRLKWHCHYCLKSYYHPSKDKRSDEKKPTVSARRQFCAEICVGKYDAFTNREKFDA